MAAIDGHVDHGVFSAAPSKKGMRTSEAGLPDAECRLGGRYVKYRPVDPPCPATVGRGSGVGLTA
jgi:hypothetical protein